MKTLAEECTLLGRTLSEKQMVSRRLTQFLAFALATFSVLVAASQPEARGDNLVLAMIVALIMIVFFLTWLILRIVIAGSTTYWSGEVRRRQVGRIALMIGTALGLQMGAGVVLDLLGRLDPVSSTVVSLVSWTLIPAAFLGLGLVQWPKRRCSASKLQLFLASSVAFSAAAAFSYAAFSVATERPEIPSISGLSVTLAVLIIAAATEEVVFRVLFLTALVDLTASRFQALFLSSLAFGMVHAPLALLQPAVRADWAMLHYAANIYAPEFLMQTALGLLFGALWLRTGSITIVVLTHAIVNVGNTLVHGL